MTSTRSAWKIAALPIVFLYAALFAPRASEAGSISLYLTIDPTTTAGVGIPAAGGFSVTSNRSGAGTWHLFAVDGATGSFGIAQVKVQLIGIVPQINNRLPQTIYDTVDDTGLKAGFTLLRSTTNANPITGSAELPGTEPYTQGGLGITAGNYSTIPGAIAFSATTNGQWGNYYGGARPPDFAPAGPRSALFVAEGTYTGAQPIVDLANSHVIYYTNAALTQSTIAFAEGGVNQLVSVHPFPPIETLDATIDNVNANSPGSLAHKFNYLLDVPGPVTWSNFTLNSYVPDAGASGTGPAIPATFDPSSHTFNWTTIGSPPGVYKWRVDATVPAVPGYSPIYSDPGFLTVHITQVPEPATLTLLGMLTVAVFGQIRLRRLDPGRHCRTYSDPSARPAIA